MVGLGLLQRSLGSLLGSSKVGLGLLHGGFGIVIR